MPKSSSKKGGASAAAASSKSPTDASNNSNNINLEEQLDKALVALQANFESTMKLHEAWRQQLGRISLLVLCIIFAQAKQPGSLCLASVQQWNTKVMSSYDKNITEEIIISKWQAFILLGKDSAMEAMSLCCAFCVVGWIVMLPVGILRENKEFHSLLFRVATALLPLIVAVFLQQPLMGCLRDMENPYGTGVVDGEKDNTATTEKRSFPVVIIFYVVTSLSMWAMKAQRSSGQDQIHKIQKLKKDLLETKKTK
ncbi:MAG: hypothetical protein SGILL_003476 [Bacillariaceae sp.]